MTAFTVVWSQQALDEITIRWMAASTEEREAILNAWHRIDDVLARDPEDVGESRGEEERVYFEYPLGVLYDIDASKMIVHLLQVWTFKKRP